MAVATEQPEKKVACFKLRLGACLTAPTKRLAADLHAASLLYNHARNAIVRSWERHAEDNGQDTFTMPELAYDLGRQAAPDLAAKLVSAATQEVSAKLRANVPWNHNGKARYVWQAMIVNEASRPCYRGHELPVPCQDAKLRLTDSGYTLEFPVWSKLSGRKNCKHICRLPSRMITPGYTRLLLKIASGEWKLCDSKLHFHEPKSRRGKGHWAIHIAYRRPHDSLGLSTNRKAVVTLMGKDAEKPFEIQTEGTFAWKIGDAAIYEREYKRLDDRRGAMRSKHRDQGGRRGHGRQRQEMTQRPITRQVHGLMHRFQWRIVAEIVKYCVRYDCGVVQFVPPTDREKASSWFGVSTRRFDWTGFMNRLRHKLWVNGIELCEREGSAPDAGTLSRVPSPIGSDGNGTGTKTASKKSTRKTAGSRKPAPSR